MGAFEQPRWIKFQSTPPMQGATHIVMSNGLVVESFNPRPPMQGATVTSSFAETPEVVSIHAPYAGSDGHLVQPHRSFRCFNPRPLCRERRKCEGKFDIAFYVSIHAPYAGSDLCVDCPMCYHAVSIHAPYAGSDVDIKIIESRSHVSIHAPYAGSDGMRAQDIADKYGFNPRPLCRERRSGEPGNVMVA